MGWQDAPEVVEQNPNAPAPLTASPAAKWQSAPLAEPYTGPERRQTARGVLQAAEAGVESSVAGLYARGKLPDLILDPSNTKWYESLASTVGQTIPDIPVMALGRVLGAFAGSPGGPWGTALGAGAGTFALPTLLRESLMRSYQNHDVQSSGEFLSRTQIAIDTGKSALAGAATFGAAELAAPFGKVAAATAATGVMTIAPALLDGRLPEPHDFLNAAVMVGGAHLAGVATEAIAGKIRTIYARTGVPPEQVAADAVKDPGLAAELRTNPDEVPPVYKPVEQAVIGPEIVPGGTAKPTAGPFFEQEGQPKAKTFDVNYDNINSVSDVSIAAAQLKGNYAADPETQRRGTVPWKQTRSDAMGLMQEAIDGSNTEMLDKRFPGTSAGDADLNSRAQLLKGALKLQADAAKDYAEKADAGKNTPEDLAKFLASVERVKTIRAEFNGATAEAGRGLNSLKMTQNIKARAEAVKAITDQYAADPAMMAKMMAQIDTPEGMLKFTKGLDKATRFQKYLEYWKSGILSDPVTQAVKLGGDISTMMTRPFVDLAAGTVRALRGGEGAKAGEAAASIYGMYKGFSAAARIWSAAIRTETIRTDSSGEQIKPAIEGVAGQIVRWPFRGLSATNDWAEELQKNMEAHRLAYRETDKAGYDMMSQEGRDSLTARAAEMRDPDSEQFKTVADAAKRFTFTAAPGKLAQAAIRVISIPIGPETWNFTPLKFIVPFTKIPGNMNKEFLRLTPGFAPLIKEWRADVAAGGARADKAMGEQLIGSLIASTVAAGVIHGIVRGAGDPDPQKHAADLAAGKQDYSIKIGDTWHSVKRVQPVGTLIGFVADLTTMAKHASEDNLQLQQKINEATARISVAFKNAVLDQPFLKGAFEMVNAMGDPQRFGARMAETFAASQLPDSGFNTYIAKLMDPSMREINSILDAIKAEIPGWRETLLPKRDIFGEPVPGQTRTLGILQSTTTTESKDPVRMEASRLGVGTAKAPLSTELPAGGDKKLGQVQLTSEQQDIFSDVSGHFAHEILSPIVNSATWETTPDLVKAEIYRKVFAGARRVGLAKALPVEQRLQEAERIRNTIMNELEKPPEK